MRREQVRAAPTGADPEGRLRQADLIGLGGLSGLQSEQHIAVHRQFEPPAEHRAVDRRHARAWQRRDAAEDALPESEVFVQLSVREARDFLEVSPATNTRDAEASTKPRGESPIESSAESRLDSSARSSTTTFAPGCSSVTVTTPTALPAVSRSMAKGVLIMVLD